MTLRSTALLVIVVAAVGWADPTAASSPPPAPPSSVPPEPAPGCAELIAMLDAQSSSGAAYLRGDLELAVTFFAALPGLLAAAQATAPPELTDALDAMAAQVPAMEELVAAAGPADSGALGAALASIPADAAAQEGFTTVANYASASCGYQPLDLLATPQPPPLCDTLDAAAAAAGAGSAVDVAEADGSAAFSLPGFAIESCSYGNGAMTLSTLTFPSLEDAVAVWSDLVTQSRATLVDVPLGELPASTVVTQLDTTVTVAVFEAAVPFSVAFAGGGVTPEAAVAGAIALLSAEG